MKFTRFEDIEGWQIGRILTRRLYALTSKPPFSRDFGLKDQILRASGSIMHNIAEGFDSGTNPEFIKFLRYSRRSCTEVQSQLYIALDQNYITKDQFQEYYDLAGDAHAKTGGLIAYLIRSSK